MTVKNDKVFVDLKTRLRKFKSEFAMEYMKRIQDKTPEQTGALKNGYTIQMKQEGFILENTQEYFSFVNNGTEHQRPQRMVERTNIEANQIAELAAKRAGLK